jgi:hypothetical protein
MHQCIIQWHEDEVEMVSADDSVSIAAADAAYWEYGDFNCFSGKTWEGGIIKVTDVGQQLIRAVGSETLF